MYLQIVSKNSKKLLFSTHWRGTYHDDIQNEIENMIRSKTNYKELKYFHFAIHIAEDLIFSSAEPYDGIGCNYDIIKNDKISDKTLITSARNFGDILSEHDMNLLKSEDPSKLRSDKLLMRYFDLNHIENNIIFDKLISTLFPFRYEIRIIGNSYSGMSSIFYKLFGLTISSKFQDIQIPLIEKHNVKKFMFKMMNVPGIFPGYLNETIPNEKFILYIVDSTDPNHLKMNPMVKKNIEKANPNQKILILANKQDLPKAMSPEEIEKTMGYQTIGFSAVAPDAPERLEIIINKFLNNN